MPGASPRGRAALRATYLVLAAVDTALAASGRPRAHRVRRITKPALMPLLLAGNPAPGHPLLVTAQVASGVGDVALLRSGDRALRAGMAGFAVAQAGYLARFAFARRLPAAERTGPPRRRIALAAVAATNSVAAGVAARRRDPALQLPTTAYGLLLSTMALTALSVRGERRARLLAGAGALSFLVSDSVLAYREHVRPDSPPALDGVVMATYTAAQVLLAEGSSRLPG